MSTLTKRIKTNVLRRLSSAPLHDWPQALIECLDTLSVYGVCDRLAMVEMLRTSEGISHETPGGASDAIEPPRTLSPQVRRACAHLRAHYDKPISIAGLASGVGRNASYLATLFRRETGMTIHGYLTSVRMERAAKLLRRREKVEAVVLLVGYRSKKNFYRQFASTFGVTPGKYRSRASSASR